MITGMPRIAIAVHDFEACVATFRDQLGLPVLDISEGSVQSLGAKLAMCVPDTGSNIELMCPANPEAPLSQSLQRFLDRRGEGLFALMLEAPSPNDEAEGLLERGLNVLPLMEGAGGRDVHPNSTHGVLIRVYPVNSFGGETSPADLTGIVRVIIAVHDIEAAAQVYGERFAIETEPARLDEDRGVHSVISKPPSGGVIELVSVADAARPFGEAIDGFLRNDREGMYALVHQAKDPGAAAEALRQKGLAVTTATDSADVVEVSRDSLYGALMRIEPLVD